MKTAFIICTRLNSRRVPYKAATEINDKALLCHLHDRLAKTGLEIIYAVPASEKAKYNALLKGRNYKLFCGKGNDPLRRMYDASVYYDVKNIIRVCHDKVFIEEQLVFDALDKFMSNRLDYLYSSSFTDGMAFEIISQAALSKATYMFSRVEHISYAIKAITANAYDMPIPDIYKTDLRLLVDYPEDLNLLNVIFANLGNDCRFGDVLLFYKNNPWIKDINRLPEISVYTCVYNGEKYINECMDSVITQDIFKDYCEYFIVDDCSKDSTSLKVSKFCLDNDKVNWTRNGFNKGLASSSNIALKEARGRYVIRLDADDFFHVDNSLKILLKTIKERDLDALYPNNYYGDFKKVQKGDEKHHCGGSLFRTRALNHIRFTEGLRNYEGLDLYERAKNQLKIGYLNKPTFFYRQTDNSMSKTNLIERAKTKEKILCSQENTQQLI